MRSCSVVSAFVVAAALVASAEAQPARRIADLNPAGGAASSFPGDFAELAGNAFFFATNAASERSLWRSDGTEAGTTRVVDPVGPGFDVPLLSTNRKLFFMQGPLWWLVASDGTQAGTAAVRGPSSPAVYVTGPQVAALGQVFFMGTEGFGNSYPLSLWRADGTGSAVSLGTFPNGSSGPLVAFHDRVMFLVAPSAGGVELWRSDGSPPGSSRVTVLSALTRTYCSGFEFPRRLGRSVVLFADDGKTGCNLWRSDGTAGGTLPIALLGGGSSEGIFPFGSSRGVLVFANNNDLWRTDGTAAGTFLLKTFSTGYALSTMRGAGTREGVYFPFSPTGVLSQLWLTNGQPEGTTLIHDFQANGENATIDLLTTANGRLLMSVTDAASGAHSIWTSDGTPAGTAPVQRDVEVEFTTPLLFRNATLFAGTDPGAGTEPWSIDGFAFAAPVRPTSLSLVNPCRVLDTRSTNDFLGGPALPAKAPRLFPVGGVCGIPWTARALAANVTVTSATADGLLRIHASDIGAPDASVMNFRAGQTRANNATIALSGDGEFTVRYETATGAGEVHVIVDVVGWYE